MTQQPKKALLVGFFSTIGDIESLDLVRGWLEEQGWDYDVAPYSQKVRRALGGAVDATEVDSDDYSHFVVICGPCHRRVFATYGIDLRRFEHCVKVGVNLTMVDPLGEWNPFDVLIERDSDRAARPDVSLLRGTETVPVVGICFIDQQPEYGDRQRHEEVRALIDDLVARRGLAAVEIDTRWPRERNGGGLGSPEEILSVMSRMDVVITNRLHGTVFALKAGTPPLVVDAVAGTDKVTAQANVLGWPVVTVGDASPTRLDERLDWCLSSEAKALASGILEDHAEALGEYQERFVESLAMETGTVPVPANTLVEPVRAKQRALVYRGAAAVYRSIRRRVSQ